VWVHVNGRLVDESEARISVFDRGFLYGDGIFESMRSIGGVIFRLDRHLERLVRSSARIGLDRMPAPDRLDAGLRRLRGPRRGRHPGGPRRG